MNPTDPKTGAERVAAFRKRQIAEGFVELRTWVHASDLDAVRALLERRSNATRRRLAKG